MTQYTSTVHGNLLSFPTRRSSDLTLAVAASGTFAGTYGSLSLATDGSYTYTLNTAGVQHLAAGATVTDSFGYQATDGTATSSASMAVASTAVTDAPRTHADAASMTEDTATVSGNVLTTDTDVDDGTLLSFPTRRSSDLTYGSLSLATDGSYTYTLNTAGVQHLAAGATVTDSFGYQATDGTATSSASMAVASTAVTDAPRTHADAASMTEDTATVSGNVLTTDTDVDDGTLLSFPTRRSSDLTYGSLSLATDGSYTYTLNTAGVQHLAAGATVTDSFGYQATDGAATSSANLVVTITGVNDAPVAHDDAASMTEDTTSVSGNVLTNDTDVDDGMTLAVANPVTVSGTYASLGPSTARFRSYTLNTAGVQHLAAGATVTDSFGYQATDGAATSSANLVVTITGVNDAPVAHDDAAGMTED